MTIEELLTWKSSSRLNRDAVAFVAQPLALPIKNAKPLRTSMRVVRNFFII